MVPWASSAPMKRSLSRVCNQKQYDLWPSLGMLSTNSARTPSLAFRRVQCTSMEAAIVCLQMGETPSLRLCNENPRHFGSISSTSPSFLCLTTGRRLFSTNAEAQKEGGKPSNRAAFKATPIVPSILAHIEKIGVGIRRKPSRKRRKSPIKGKRSGDTILDEAEELGYFAEHETRHRIQWREKPTGPRERGGKSKSANQLISKHHGNEASKNRGAFWLPPPPFSSFSKVDAGAPDDSLNGRRIMRRPVKLLGKAGSLKDNLPRESRGLSEVAIAGRSNVGKSTLLNALLYGNTDENLSPRQHQRGKTPDGAKLPKGVKAATSAKPGQTKELTFYQLTADVVTNRCQAGSAASEEDKMDSNERMKDLEKMSLLLVDLPGYGFAFAKEERTKEWNDLMHHYLLERRGLKRILLLLDARHGFKKADFDFLGNLQDGLLARIDGDDKARRELPPVQIVLTKCDLVKQVDLARRVVVVRRQLSDFLVREPSSLPVMLVSARAGLGFNNVRKETPLGGVLELQRELASLVPTPRHHRKKH